MSTQDGENGVDAEKKEYSNESNTVTSEEVLDPSKLTEKGDADELEGGSKNLDEADKLLQIEPTEIGSDSHKKESSNENLDETDKILQIKPTEIGSDSHKKESSNENLDETGEAEKLLQKEPSKNGLDNVVDEIPPACTDKTDLISDASTSEVCFVSKLWNCLSGNIRKSIKCLVMHLAVGAARFPYLCIIFVMALSIAVIVTGIKTNFSLNVNHEEILVPRNTLSGKHYEWMQNYNPNDDIAARKQVSQQRRGLFSSETAILNGYETLLDRIIGDKLDYDVSWPVDVEEKTHNFFHPERMSERRRAQVNGAGVVTVIIHGNGENILGIESMNIMFDLLDAINDNEDACFYGCGVIYGATDFWHNNRTKYEEAVKTEEDLRKTLSRAFFPDGTMVDIPALCGKAKMEDNVIVYAESYTIHFYGFTQMGAIEVLTKFRDDVANKGDIYRADFFTIRSYEEELFRSIIEDLPLLGTMFILLFVVTAAVMFRCDKVHSKCFLAFGSIITIIFSIMTGYGLLFAIGVPFTPVTPLLTFLVFGVGLDDTFIITVAYNRTDEKKDPVERVRETMNEVGLSIATTTATTALAFGFGLISTVPSIYWLCMYAFPTIIIDFIYQITFFIALVTLDSRRIKANRMDCCICFTSKIAEPTSIETQESRLNKHPIDRFMAWYAEKLLVPRTKHIVIFTFVVYFFICVFTSSRMTQEFKISDLVPKDSYARSFVKSFERYSTRAIPAYVYFRGVDQTNETIRQQMIDYTDELASIEMFGEPPPFCWVRDFPTYLKLNRTLQTLPYKEQISYLLDIPILSTAYWRDFQFDNEGNIGASRCVMWFNDLELDSVSIQIQALQQQRKVSARQPLNKAADSPENWPFFTFGEIYLIWEMYDSAIKELVATTISALVAVAIVVLIAVPHWSAVLFTVPMVSVLYVDLIGTIQYVGVRINPLSYVALVISIGLMVDFVVHFLIRYYESTGQNRDEKVKEALETTGVAIFYGGFSTLAAAFPLLFSTSTIFVTIFYSIFTMIALSMLHGLVFLPVVLSYIGPIKAIQLNGVGNFMSNELSEDDEKKVLVETNDDSQANEQEKALE